MCFKPLLLTLRHPVEERIGYPCERSSRRVPALATQSIPNTPGRSCNFSEIGTDVVRMKLGFQSLELKHSARPSRQQIIPRITLRCKIRDHAAQHPDFSEETKCQTECLGLAAQLRAASAMVEKPACRWGTGDIGDFGFPENRLGSHLHFLCPFRLMLRRPTAARVSQHRVAAAECIAQGR